VKAQAIFPGGLLEGRQERVAVFVVPKHGPPLVAARGDMIEGSGEFDAKRPCHGRFLRRRLQSVKSQELTPFPTFNEAGSLIGKTAELHVSHMVARNVGVRLQGKVFPAAAAK
jgi:hypothetical protein